MDSGQKSTEKSWNVNLEDNQQTDIEQTQENTILLEPISWTGSEFISNHKSTNWYVILFAIVGLISILIYLISKDLLSIFFVVVVGLLFGIIASRKPRQLQFIIDENGITVGGRKYPYADFISFSVQHDGAIGYINLLPLHRFKNELSIYYPPENEQKIMGFLENQLPHDQRKENIVDKLAKFIKF